MPPSTENVPWNIPVAVYRQAKAGAPHAFVRMVEMQFTTTWPPFITLDTFRAIRPVDLERAPFLILIDHRDQATAVSAYNAAWPCAPERMPRSSQYHQEADALMLHYTSLIVSYAMVAGGMRFRDACTLFSDVQCMPSRIEDSKHLRFLQTQRIRTARKQSRDVRLVLEAALGRAATYSLPSGLTVDLIRDPGPTTPPLHPEELEEGEDADDLHQEWRRASCQKTVH